MYEIMMYTREQVGEALHVHVNTVSMLREIGVLQSIKIGKITCFQNQLLNLFK